MTLDDDWNAFDFGVAVATERIRQKELGYTLEHDCAKGVSDLLAIAQIYIFNGKLVKAAAIVEAAKEVYNHD